MVLDSKMLLIAHDPTRVKPGNISASTEGIITPPVARTAKERRVPVTGAKVLL